MNCAVDRFLAKVMKTSTCWEWVGAKKPSGYGNFWLDGKHVGAHVASYLLFNGKIPDGLQIHHACNNPHCVNPEHLQVVTPSRNILESENHWNRTKTHCIRGHEFTEENTYTHPVRRNRNCRVCKRLRAKGVVA